eukprot:3940928-Rhodomonas_salina.2
MTMSSTIALMPGSTIPYVSTGYRYHSSGGRRPKIAYIGSSIPDISTGYRIASYQISTGHRIASFQISTGHRIASFQISTGNRRA